MWFKSSNVLKRKNIYSVFLKWMIISITCTVLFVSIVLFINFDSIMINTLTKSAIENLVQTKQSINLLKNYAKMICLQVYYDPSISTLLSVFEPDIFELSRAYSKMHYFKTATPYVESIYLFNNKTHKYYAISEYLNSKEYDKEQFYDKNVLSLIEENMLVTNFVPIKREIISENNPNKKISVYTFIFSDKSNTNYNDNQYVILNLNTEWFENTLSFFENRQIEGTIVIDGNGRLVAGNNENKSFLLVSQDDFIKYLSSLDQEKGFMIKKIENKDYLITYVIEKNDNEYIFLRATLFDSLSMKIKDARFLIAFLILVLLSAGLIYSVYAAKRIYNPVNTIINNLKALEEERRNNYLMLRKTAFKDLVSSPKKSNEKIKEIVNKFKINFDFNKDFIPVILRIDNFYEYSQNKSSEEIELYNYAISNIASEVCCQYFSFCESFGEEYDSVLLFFNYEEKGSKTEQTIVEMLENIVMLVKTHLGISVSAIYDKNRYSFFDLNKDYKRLLNSSENRFYYGYSKVFSVDNQSFLNSSQFNYPYDIEKEIISSLNDGNLELTKERLNDFFAYLMKYPYEVFNFTIVSFCFTLKRMIESKRKRESDYPKIIHLDDLIKYSYKFDTVNKVKNMIIEVFEEIINENKEKRTAKINEITNMVINTINSEYSSEQLSLSFIADKVGYSSSYLNKLFYENTGKHISDVIIEIRMQKAAEFLLDTKEKISDIAAKVGYSDASYFFKVFKSKFNCTPNEFRKK